MKSLFTTPKLIAALFAALFTLTLHGVSNAQTLIHVDAVNGINAATGRGAAGKAYKSITYALLISEKSNLPDPWHVHIHPGTYDADPAKPANEREVFPIKLRSNMIFQGTTTAEECILDAQHLGRTQTSILLGEDVGEVSIRNLTVQNMQRTNGAGGIVFSDTGGGRETTSSIETCIIQNNYGGVRTNLPLVLIGNTFSNNYVHGVRTNTSLTALNNTFRDNTGNALRIEGDSVGNIFENTFQNNMSTHTNGGGIRVDGDLTGDVTRNQFIGNSTREFGGGFFVNTLKGNITHNTFENNSSDRNGGGFHADRITGNVTHNTFKGNSSGHEGGGFNVNFQAAGDVSHNTFIRNTAPHGGGFGSTVGGKITHNLFDSNSAERERGGAIYLLPGVNPEITNNIFFNNTASTTSGTKDSSAVVFTFAATLFTNNLFMVSDGLSAAASIPAVKVFEEYNPECRFHNNIFSGMKTAIYIEGDLDLPITHNLFHNIGMDFVNQGGSGVGNDLAFWELLADGANNNIVGGLLLVDPGNRDFHPVVGSPTIDAGTNAYAPADDFDGVARPIGGTVDIGPYEYKGSTGQTATFLPEDVNQDGKVSIADVIAVAQSLGKPVSENPRADVNGNGTISFADLVAIARYIAKARSETAAAPWQKAVVLDAATVQTWLQLARVEDDGSLAFREGIANLERLLASLLPKETVLLANYPNPFNPETWIPYQLAKPAEVTLTIYAVGGRVVRQLTLGHQPAGMYHNKRRAAYWDGRNAQGEEVASGLYFYTLTAGDFTATRKMLIRK